ncbi:MAG: hypothetical protein BRD57_05000 [Proteobacteria bacterium SW_6_67_9]|jgi:hypothetical protein|nr:MAG: hypothetical protein BRD57_05000 [Proteobacteria bacterium SW_6_67_9]
MDEETFNKEIRSFLKKVGITSQREIEQAVQERVADGRLNGDETLSASLVLRVPEIDLTVTLDETLRLE